MDKTGAEATVSAANGKYTIAVEGETVGLKLAVADRRQPAEFSTTQRSMNGSADAAWRTSWWGKLSRRARKIGNAYCPPLPDGGRVRQEAPGVQRHH